MVVTAELKRALELIIKTGACRYVGVYLNPSTQQVVLYGMNTSRTDGVSKERTTFFTVTKPNAIAVVRAGTFDATRGADYIEQIGIPFLNSSTTTYSVNGYAEYEGDEKLTALEKAVKGGIYYNNTVIANMVSNNSKFKKTKISADWCSTIADCLLTHLNKGVNTMFDTHTRTVLFALNNTGIMAYKYNPRYSRIEVALTHIMGALLRVITFVPTKVTVKTDREFLNFLYTTDTSLLTRETFKENTIYL